MPEKSWKRWERQVAAYLGGSRVPVSGRGDGPDVAHDRLLLECKLRKEIPQWLLSAMAQAHSAGPPDRYPVVVMKTPGMRTEDGLAVIPLRVLRELLEEVENADSGTVPRNSHRFVRQGGRRSGPRVFGPRPDDHGQGRRIA